MRVFLLAMLLSCASAVSLAADYSIVLTDIYGHELGDDIKCPPDRGSGARSCDDKLTLGAAVANALLQVDDANARIKWERWMLAQKVIRGGVVEFDAADTAMIIDRLGKLYGPMVVGPAAAMLDPNFGKAR